MDAAIRMAVELSGIRIDLKDRYVEWIEYQA